MSDGINLSAAIRDSLQSLQQAQSLINTTQNDLGTGLSVNNAVDNSVAYFQASALSDRASDFSNKKSTIDQGISSLSNALVGITGIQGLVSQLEGLALNSASASPAQEPSLVTQFNSLRSQINTLSQDASYQGLNLIAGTGQTLTVSFSTVTASNLTVKSVDVTSGVRGLQIAKAVTSVSLTGKAGPLTVSASTAALNAQSVFNWSGALLTAHVSQYLGTAGNSTTQNLKHSLKVTFAGSSTKFTQAGTYSFKYGTLALTFRIASAAGITAGALTADLAASSAVATVTQNFHYTQSYRLKIVSAGKLGGKATTGATAGKTSAGAAVGSAIHQTTLANGYLWVTLATGEKGFTAFAGATATSLKQTLQFLTGQYTLNRAVQSSITILNDQLANNLNSLRGQAQVLGSNVALLNTRLSFTNNYVNLLSAGSGKLTLADLNAEGANLLSLQTRQQLGIQALSFAGQSEKAVLQLFR